MTLDVLRAHLEDWTGLDLAGGNRAPALDRCVEARRQALGLPTPEAYLRALRANRDEAGRLLDAVTVCHSWFYRDRAQFDAIARLLERGLGEPEPLRAWVPACASGEDAYTLAMLCASIGRRAVIVGSDLSPRALSQAEQGCYGAWSLRALPAALREFVEPRAEGLGSVRRDVRRLVTFRQHNLVTPPPEAPGGSRWDLVICRNVLIYLSRAAVARVLSHLAAALRPGGWLFVGATEALLAVPAGLSATRVGGCGALRREEPVRGAPNVGPPSAATASEERAAIRRSGDAVAVRPPSGQAPRAPAPTALLRRGLEALQRGSASEALAPFMQAVEAEPLHAESHLLAGIAFLWCAEVVRAVHHLEAAWFLDPDLWPAAFYLALAHERLGNEREAGRYYSAVARLPADRATPPRDLVALQEVEPYLRDAVSVARARAGAREGGPAGVKRGAE